MELDSKDAGDGIEPDAGHMDSSPDAMTGDIDHDAGMDAAADVMTDGSVDLDAGLDAATGELDAAPSTPAPTISSFTGPAQACIGSTITLNHAFENGNGTISPGAIAVAALSTETEVTLEGTTEYMLSVTGAGGGPVLASTTVTAIAGPTASIVAPAKVSHDETGVSVSVTSQPNRTYAWSIKSGDAAVTAGATANAATLSIGSMGKSVTVQLVITDTITTCVSTLTKTIAVPCSVPQVISFNRAAAPDTFQYVPSNEGARPLATIDGGMIWASYLTPKIGASYDFAFARLDGDEISDPPGAPATLNDATPRVIYIKVASDGAGNAVFVWSETTDSSTFTVKLRAYRASDETWLAAKTLGTSQTNVQHGPVSVAMHATNGTALAAWVSGAYGSAIPHFRSYAIATDTLGADTAVTATTTNTLAADNMSFTLALNGNLDGALAWFEQNTSHDLKVLHVTGGAPDMQGMSFDIKKLATSTTAGDEISANSLTNQTPIAEPRLVSVSANGKLAVIWSSYTYDAMAGYGTGKLSARRYAGTWDARELVASQQGAAFASYDFAIDDQGEVIYAERTHNSHVGFGHGKVGAAWSSVHTLATNPTSHMPVVVVDSESGRGAVLYRDPGKAGRAPLRAVLYDPVAGELSAALDVDDPHQSAPAGGRAFIDGDGKLQVVFVQALTSPPVGATLSNNALVYFTACE